MIDVVRLWETLAQSAKTGTSGYQTASEFNRDLESVQTSLLTLLAPQYAKNIQIQDILAPFIETTSNNATKPIDYFQFVSAEVNGYPSYPIAPNQVEIYKTSPIRKPSSTNNLSYYYFADDKINFVTDGGNSGDMIYIRYPERAYIVLNQVSNADSDYVTPAKGEDLEWPESAFNLILYMMMQRMGLSMKESLLLELSQLGLQQEASKL